MRQGRGFGFQERGRTVRKDRNVVWTVEDCRLRGGICGAREQRAAGVVLPVVTSLRCRGQQELEGGGLAVPCSLVPRAHRPEVASLWDPRSWRGRGPLAEDACPRVRQAPTLSCVGLCRSLGGDIAPGACVGSGHQVARWLGTGVLPESGSV